MKLSINLLACGLSAALAVPIFRHANPPKGKWFDRFVVIVLENQNKDVTNGNPYFKNLASQGMLLAEYHGVTHPSQPNYITMITNTNNAGIYDDSDRNTTEMSIVDLFEPAGITWKAYMEGYRPLANGDCNPYHEDEETLYARKHNPFMSFDNIRNSTSRCRKIVNAEEHFAKDVALGKDAPQYMYYTPNLLNDAHDTNVSYASHDIRKVVNTMLDNKEFMENTLIVVTFDENDIFSEPNWGTPNLIYTVLLGNDTLQCYNCQDQQYYNHFSQVVTLEKNWDLPYIPHEGGGWDQWWLPFNMLRTKDDPKACAYAKCGHITIPEGE